MAEKCKPERPFVTATSTGWLIRKQNNVLGLGSRVVCRTHMMDNHGEQDGIDAETSGGCRITTPN